LFCRDFGVTCHAPGCNANFHCPAVAKRGQAKKKETYSRNMSKFTAVMTPQAKKLRILSYLSLHAKAMVAILCHTLATFAMNKNCTNRDSRHITILILSKSRTSHSIRGSLHRGCGQDLRTCDGDFPLRLAPAMDPTVQGRKGLRRDVATVCQRYGHDHSAQIITYVYHVTNCLRPSSLAVPACLQFTGSREQNFSSVGPIRKN
jgi:hypothetical protein